MSSSVFDQCRQEFPDGDGTALLQCVSNFLQAADEAKEANLKNFLFVISGAMVFFMQAGFATLCAGAVRIKNVQNTMLKNLLDACGAAVAFFLVGELISRVSVNDLLRSLVMSLDIMSTPRILYYRVICHVLTLLKPSFISTIFYYLQVMRLRLVVKTISRKPPSSVQQTLPPLDPRLLSGSSNTLSLPLRLLL